MKNKDYKKRSKPIWLTEDGEKILNEIEEIKNSRINGMEKFKKQRSKILQLSYICMKNTDSDFGSCQKKAWQLKRDRG
jgi:hypothetical protein